LLALAAISGGCIAFGPGANDDDEGSDDGEHHVSGGGNVDQGAGHTAAEDAGPVCDGPIASAGDWRIDRPFTFANEHRIEFEVARTSASLASGGCLARVDLTLRLQDMYDCQLDITAGPEIDTQGRLLVSRLVLDTSGACPGIPDEAVGVYYAIDDSLGNDSTVRATLAFEGTRCDAPSSVLDKTCYEGLFDHELHGQATKLGTGSLPSFPFDFDAGALPDAGFPPASRLDFEGARLQLRGHFCAYPTDSACPARAE
jgi:hypothetical protein